MSLVKLVHLERRTVGRFITVSQNSSGFSIATEKVDGCHLANARRRLDVCGQHGSRVTFLPITVIRIIGRSLSNEQVNTISLRRIMCLHASRQDGKPAVDNTANRLRNVFAALSFPMCVRSWW